LGKIVKNIFVQSIQHEKLGITVAAKGSRFTDKNGDNFIEMQNGRRYEGPPGSAEFSTTEFEKYAIRVKPAEVKQEPIATISKTSLELFQHQNNANIAELQWRMAIPILTIILVFLAIPISSVDSRAGRSANFVLAIVIYIIYINLLSVLQALVSRGQFNALVGLWPIHLIFGTLTLYIFYRREQQLPMLPETIITSWLKIRGKLFS
jgi:lipopolysaccharide export system permease protein